MTGYILFFLFGVLISAVSQIMLKLAAREEHKSWIYEYLNVKVIVAYAIFFGATLITVFCYKGLPLSLGAMLDATGYVFVTVLGHFILKESVSKRKILGIALVIVGIIIAAV